MPSLPTVRISFDHAKRCWLLRSPSLPETLRFASRGKGAAGLVGALGMAVFTHRETGGRIELTFAQETLIFWFDGTGDQDLIH